MPEYISGEEHRALQQHTSQRSIVKPVLAIVGALVIAVLGFFGGVQYQKVHGTKANTRQGFASGAGSQFGAGGNFGGGMRRGTIGQVTAISSTSITVSNNRTGSSDTLTITSSTTATNNGQTAAISDIKVGDTVLIRTVTSDSSQAASIDINPSFGGMGGSASSGQTDDSTTQTN